jgi:hypothetical protein
MSRRIWRFPFDDEIATLSKIEPDAVRAFIAGFPATDDWLITAAGGGIGLFSAYWIFTYRLPSVQAEFSADPIRAALTDLLGFFGGDALGISQAWIVAPAVIVSAAAAACAIDRHEPAKPVHLLLLMLSGPVFMALAGFSTPRSFLYLAPVLAGLMTMFCDQQLRGVYHDGCWLPSRSFLLLAFRRLPTSIPEHIPSSAIWPSLIKPYSISSGQMPTAAFS